MTRQQTTRVLAVAVLLAAAAAGIVRTKGWRSPVGPQQEPGQEPQDAIYAMLSAARAGDVKAYLARYTGNAGAALRSTLAETTESGFANYLREANSGVRGVAISDPQKITGREVKVRVEYIYQDRDEAQEVYLEDGPGGWRISRTEGDERVKTLVPYGAPVK
ncbi:MAG TPA: hypothetical protein VKF41_02660 [Bryobacteraceae bacterium]|nr:hypothetical protein [Bryobacteraceae bacterium]